jgi:hypothetical protein
MVSNTGGTDSMNLFASTTLVSFFAIGYSLYYIKNKIQELITTKKDKDENELLEDTIYQGWSGAFADGEESVLITIIRQKVCTKQANTKWIDWDGSDDTSVINRNFYMGNENPNFSWNFKQRESDTEAMVKETLTDGWNSIIQQKIVAYVKDKSSDTEMNAFLKKIVNEDKIDWQKTLFTKRETEGLFT